MKHLLVKTLALSLVTSVSPGAVEVSREMPTQIDYRIEYQLNEFRARLSTLTTLPHTNHESRLLERLVTDLDRVESWWLALPQGRFTRNPDQIHFYLARMRAQLEANFERIDSATVTLEPGESEETISGIVTASDLPPPATLEGIWVEFFDSSGGWVGTAPTDADGVYTSPVLGAGTYFAKTWNDQSYVDELYDDVPCHNICDISLEGSPIILDEGQSVGDIDFELEPGGTITGSIAQAVGGAPIENVIVDIFDTSGRWVSNAISQLDGTYDSFGLPAGNYYARTYNEEHYLEELYDDIACPFYCDPVATAGTQIPVIVGHSTSGIDFDLEAGGFLSGSVSSIGVGPLEGVGIEIFDSGGMAVGWGQTEADGEYETQPGLPTGSYFAVTSSPRPYLDEIYDDVYCPAWCDPLAGTEITVTAGLEKSDIDFVLTTGGMISGHVRDSGGSSGIAGIWVELYDATGNHVDSALTELDGSYLSPALPAGGPYFAKTWNDLGYLDELFQEQPCSFGCDIAATGTPIPVIAEATLLMIDFTLDEGATITGHVTSAATDLAGVFVEIFGAAGERLSGAITDETGTYTSQALPAGTYYCLSGNDLGYLNEIFDDVPCPNWCDPTDGTPIVASAGDAITGIDFDLALGGMVSGAVVQDPSEDPIEGIFVDIFDSTSGDHVSWGATDASGTYLTFYALNPGNYTARTWNDLGLADELYDDISCINCDVTAGDVFEVTTGNTTTGIDFGLEVGGLISGTVTESGTSDPVVDVHVEIFDSAGDFRTFGVTDGDGEYIIYNALPAGSYFAEAVANPPHISELYENIPCHFGCDVSLGSPIAVVSGSTVGIDFELQIGGYISGEVTDDSETPLEDIHVNVHDTAGVLLTWEPTRADGSYTTSWTLPAGTYFVSTWTDQGYVNEIFDDVECLACDVTLGKKVVVSSGSTTSDIDFDLGMGGRIAGSITEAGTGAPIPNTRVLIHESDGRFIQGFRPDGDGAYISPLGMPSGNYHVLTSTLWGAGPRYVNEIFDDIACPGECDPTTGAPVAVQADSTTRDIDFELALGGQISGTVLEPGSNLPIDSSEVVLFDAAGNFMDTTRVNAAGEFTSFRAVPTGTYYAATRNFDGYLDELYSETACPGGGGFCSVTAGTPISIVAGSVTSEIDFTLEKVGGWIGGKVTDAVWGHGLPPAQIDIYNQAGEQVTRVLWNRPNPADGSYKTCGLPAGSYFAKVDPSVLVQSYATEVFDGYICPLGCDETLGTPIPVSEGSGTQDINFELVPLVFADGFESMDTSAWTKVHP